MGDGCGSGTGLDPDTEFIDNFFDKQFYNSVKIGPYFFLQHFKAKLIYNFVKFCGWDQSKNPDFYPTFQHLPCPARELTDNA